MRAEDASDLLGRFVDIVRGDAGEVRKPFGLQTFLRSFPARLRTSSTTLRVAELL
ncbi:hypothetical protein ABIF66_010650 [Bradyrhizobium japonicum]